MIRLIFNTIIMKKIILALFVTVSLASVACHKHNDSATYTIGISIEKPTEGEVLINNTAAALKVQFKRDNNETIHNVSIELVKPDATRQKLFNQHVATNGTYSYNQSSAFTPAVTGNYQIVVTSTDNDEKQPNTLTRNFRVE